MTGQEAIKYLKDANRNNQMVGILPKSDIGKCLINALEEIQQYRTIGTPEKCRAAVEKQKAKNPQKTESEGYRYTDTYRCPNCGGNFSGTGIANYCYHCGQKLDWGDVE